MMLEIAGKQSVGRRDNQEDAYKLVLQDEQNPTCDLLMVLADGMGGHAGGEVASTLACKVFSRHFVSAAKAKRPRPRLEETLHAANAALREKIAEDSTLRGMGCTLIGALKMENRLSWVSVGDSILFLLRKGELRRLNADHSYYGELLEMVKDGKLTQQEADNHPRRNALRAAVMGESISLVDLEMIELEVGDLVLLATDGIETLSDVEIASILTREAHADVRALCSDLLNAVEQKARSNQDNTTVIAYRHSKGGAATRSSTSQWSGLVDGPQSLQEKNLKNKLLAGALVASFFLGMVMVWAFSGEKQGSEPPAPPPAQGTIATPQATAPRTIPSEGLEPISPEQGPVREPLDDDGAQGRSLLPQGETENQTPDSIEDEQPQQKDRAPLENGTDQDTGGSGTDAPDNGSLDDT